MAKILKEKQSWYFLGLWLLTTLGAWALLFNTPFFYFISLIGRFSTVLSMPVFLAAIQFIPIMFLMPHNQKWFWLTLIPHFFFFWAGLIFSFESHLGGLPGLAGLALGASSTAGVFLFVYNRIWGSLIFAMAIIFWIVIPVLLNNIVIAKQFLQNIPPPILILLSLPYLLIIGLILLLGFRSEPERIEKAAS
jgi:hypothetical protein